MVAFRPISPFGKNYAPHEELLLGDLLLSIQSEDLEKAQHALTRGADANAMLVHGKNALHLAIERNSPRLVLLLAKTTSNIDQETATGLTALEMAISLRHYDLVQKLLDNGANPSQIIGRKGYTAQAFLHFLGAISTPLSKADNYSAEFIKRKVLSHFLSLKGQSILDGVQFSLTGAHAPYFFAQIKAGIEVFFKSGQGEHQLSKLHQKTLVDAFEWASFIRAPSEILDRVKRRTLTIVPCTWYCHSIALIFFKNYLTICNRGENGDLSVRTLETFKIDPKRINLSTILSIQKQWNNDSYSAAGYFYKELPQSLSSTKDLLCSLIENNSPKLIKGGICSLACGKAALLAATILLKTKNMDQKNLISASKQCKIDYKKWTLYARFNALKSYLESPTPGFDQDEEIIIQSLQILDEKLKRSQQYMTHITQVVKNCISLS